MLKLRGLMRSWAAWELKNPAHVARPDWVQAVDFVDDQADWQQKVSLMCGSPKEKMQLWLSAWVMRVGDCSQQFVGLNHWPNPAAKQMRLADRHLKERQADFPHLGIAEDWRRHWLQESL